MTTYIVRKRIVREIVYLIDAESRAEAVALADDMGEVDTHVPGARIDNDYIVRQTWYVNGSHTPEAAS